MQHVILYLMYVLILIKKKTIELHTHTNPQVNNKLQQFCECCFVPHMHLIWFEIHNLLEKRKSKVFNMIYFI